MDEKTINETFDRLRSAIDKQHRAYEDSIQMQRRLSTMAHDGHIPLDSNGKYLADKLYDKFPDEMMSLYKINDTLAEADHELCLAKLELEYVKTILKVLSIRVNYMEFK